MHNAQDIVKQMSIDIGILPGHLLEIIRTAPLRYKVFKIPKKNGGEREVAQPAREVKKIQRWIIDRLSEVLPVHEATTAYKAGSSILKNAQAHAQNNFLLKVDFQTFFPSILKDDIVTHFKRYCSEDYDDSAIALMAYCLCWAPNRKRPLRLCIGAPSSPLISNSILYDFDAIISAAAEEQGIVYTRYADDISLSSSKRGELCKMFEFIRTTTKTLDYPSLTINPRKTVFASRKGKKVVTGIVLTPDRRVSVGRERKKMIRAMYYRFRVEELSLKDVERLHGLIAFVESIEPGFKRRLEASYNAKVLRNKNV